MEKYLIIAVLLVGLSWTLAKTKVPVFVSGDDGHKSYRIPSIIAPGER